MPGQLVEGTTMGDVIHKHRDTFEVVVGAVTGTLTQPGELILGRYDDDGELVIIGRTSPINRGMARSLTPLLRPATSEHPWPSNIRSSAYDRFGPKRETQLTLIEPLTAEISADTAMVGGPSATLRASSGHDQRSIRETSTRGGMGRL